MATIDTQTVTVGFYDDTNPYTNLDYYGFNSSNSTGSISDGTCNFLNGDAYAALYYVPFTNSLVLTISTTSGASADNSFDSVTIDGNTFNESNATFTSNASFVTWTWSTTTNPFGTTTGVQKTVTFDDGIAITAPTASNVTVDNPNTQTYTATFNLSAAGSGGTLEYSIEKNDSTPDAWIAASSDTQTQFTATISRSNPPGTIYAQARRSATAVSSIVSVTGTGYIAPDKVVDTISDINITTETSVNIPITNGDTLTTYHAKDGGTTLDTVAGAGASTANLVISSNLPAEGSSLTVYLYGQRLYATGGDNNLYALNSPNNTVVISRATLTAPTDLTFSTATTASATTNVTVTASGGSSGTLQVSEDGTNWVANGTAFSKTRGTNYTFYARVLGAFGGTSSSYSEAYSVPCTAPTGMSFSVASLSSPSENVTVTASGGYGGVLQVSEDNVNWDPSGTVYSKLRGDSYTFYSRRVGDAGTESSVTSGSFPVDYLDPDTAVAATSSIIAYAAGSATTTISGVDRTTEEVAVRTNNGATNLGTRTGNGDITFTGSLPAAGAVTTYEIFTRRPTATGGDGTTWTATNDTFTVEQTPSAPTSISRTYAFTASPTTTVTVTASGGTGGTLQVSDDNSTWVANGTAFTVTRGSSYVFYARRVGDGTSVSGVYTSSSAAVPYLNADTVVAATSSTISNSATSATTKISAVDRATEEVAVRLNNGSTNIATRTGNGAITFSTSLPAAGTVTTYEIFTQRTVDTGGDGTTWYATDDTFTVGREVSAPTDIAFSPVIAYAENTDIIVTASGGTGGTLQVSDDNSTWVANGSSFGPYAKGSTVGPFYARRTSSVNNSASYSDSFTIPYDTPWTNYQVAEPYPVLGATTTQATIQVAVAVTYQDVAVRLNNGSTNLETVLAPTTSFVDIVIDNGLPGEEETLTYELFARLPVANGGDGTTWYQTNKTFTISRQSSIRVSPGQPISLLQVQTFVVDTGSAIITEYYRSPNGDVPALPQNSAVPLSGTISMDDFYGIESISAPAEFTRSIVINGSASLRDNSVFSGNNCNFAFPASGFKDHIDVPGTWRIFYKTSGGDFSTNRYIDHVESVVDFVTGDISGTASVIFGGTLSTANATEIRDFYGVATGTLTIPANCITMYRKA